MTCGETCSSTGCHQGHGCAAHRQHYDTLANRMQVPTSASYLKDLFGALAIAAVIATPAVIYFWNLT